MPSNLPSVERLLSLVEEELANMAPFQQPNGSCSLSRRIRATVLAMPVSALLGEVITAPMKPALHDSLQAELTRLRLQCMVSSNYS